QNRKLEQAETRIGQVEKREDRMGEQFEHSKKQKDELSDKQVNEITEVNNVENMLNRIKDLKSKVNTGPLKSRASDVAMAVLGDQAPGVSEDYVALRQL